MTPVESVWQEHRGRLRDYIARRAHDPHTTDDILQEVFLKLHGGLHSVKSQGSVAAWLYRVAANAITDHYRAQKPGEELPDELATPEPERDYVAELAACLQPLITDLPEKYRVALELSEIGGLTQQAVADRLGISLSGAKSRVQRGREKLRERLALCCEIETGRGGGVIGYEVRDKKSGGCGGCAE